MEKNSLEDLFEFAPEPVVVNRKVLLVDGHNLAYRTVFSAVNQMPSDNDQFVFWKHIMIKVLFAMIRKFEPQHVVLTFDDYKHDVLSWRKEIYNDYKFKRKDARDKSIVDFKKFFGVFNDFIEEVKETFPNIRTIMVDGCEGDDIIAVLAKEVFNDKEVIILSTDGDMNQLTQYPWINQYDPLKKKIIKAINPVRDLQLKIIMGDKSDNIPAIKPKCGKVTAEKIIVNQLLDDLLEDPKIKENYFRNLKLIDFNYIPQSIQDLVKKSYENLEVKSINKDRLMKFFVENSMLKMMDQWQTDSKYVKVLN